MLTLVTYCAEALERARLFDLSEKAVRARDNMISVSAHELLTPVSGSKLQMQILKRKIEQGAELSRELLLKMATQTDDNLSRLSKLVNDMLDMSRINLGKLTLEPEKVNLSQVVQDTVDRTLGLADAAGCKVTASIESDVFAVVDAYRIEQVITNLISNACRYAYGKPIRIRLERESSDRVRILVADQGMGIKKQDQARIFERFERATSLDEKAGLGLGLFIVKQIVEAHQGWVRVESEPGQGATFVVELPLSGSIPQGSRLT
jgi:signal transduction histidine kinase